MKIAYLGTGAWGFCLANLLASNGHEVCFWGIEEDVLLHLEEHKEHPRFPGIKIESTLFPCHDFKQAVDGAEMIVESVTTKGLRPVLSRLLELGPFHVPFIITSKGIEQKSGLLNPEIALEVLGDKYQNQIGCLSGPTVAQDVLHKMPTTIVASAFDPSVRETIAQAFVTSYFRVYLNPDVIGVAFGGAMKNIIAIASGICDGLELGDNTKAAMITRGLHEMRRLAKVKGCDPETLNGLSGLGDLCVTCLSSMSRNYKFGKLIADGLEPEKAKKKIGMVVEGANTCISARELSRKHGVEMPISEAVYQVVYENLDLKQAIHNLLSREVKDERL